MMMNSNTAILFFTRSASLEARHKTLVSRSQSYNQELISCLIHHSSSIAKASKLPVYTIDSAQQVGNSFGERLANAIEQVYSKGYEKVICIGNDCPELTTSQIEQSAKVLEKESTVLGPSTDGGVYLLGIDQSAYCRDSFLKISWQSTQVFTDLLDYIKEISNSTPFILSSKTDIDSWKDLKKLLPELKRSLKKIYDFIRFILHQKISFKPLNFIPKNNLIFQNLSFRAPPQ